MKITKEHLTEIEEKDIRKDFEEFWLTNVYPDGITVNDLAKELYDLRTLTKNVTCVYDALANLSKPFTPPEAIIKIARENFSEQSKEYAEELIVNLIEEGVLAKKHESYVKGEIGKYL